MMVTHTIILGTGALIGLCQTISTKHHIERYAEIAHLFHYEGKRLTIPKINKIMALLSNSIIVAEQMQP